MPYFWKDLSPGHRRLTIWPNRSLPATGFVWMIGIACTGLALPLLALLGRAALWGLLPFAALAVGGLWMAIRANNRGGQTYEVADLSQADLAVTRHDPGRPDRTWHGNPYWVRLTLCDGPVERYLTLTDGGREIELGAFLSPQERVALHDELIVALRRARDQSSST